MKKIVLAIALAALATSALATPRKPQCDFICRPTEEEPEPTYQTEQAEPLWLEEQMMSPDETEQDAAPVTGK